MPFPWRWNGDTISLNSGVVWETPGKLILPDFNYGGLAMLSCQRFGLRLIAVLFSITLSAALGSGQSRASGFEDALTLIRSGDIKNIERTFDAQYQDFVVGEISIRQFNTPYNAFLYLGPGGPGDDR